MNQVLAEIRTNKGKGASRRLRLENKIPAIVYGGEKDPVSLSLKHNEFTKSIENASFFSQLITLSIEGKEECVVLKDIHRHPYKAVVIHVDFQRVSDDVALKIMVPLIFVGEDDAPGIQDGGLISRHLTTIEVECLPKDIPEVLEIDVSAMGLEELLHLSNIHLPEGVALVALKYGAKFDAPVAALYKSKK